MNHNLDLIRVRDNEDIIEFTYQDLLKYHGNNMVGGVALAYKMMLWAFPKLCDDIPQRGSFYFYSGIGPNGKGMIDAVELVMRVRSFGHLDTDISRIKDKSAPPTPRDGRYYFEIGYQEKMLAISLKPDLIPDDFYYYSKLSIENEKNHRRNTPDEQAQLQHSRNNLASLILETPPDELFCIYTLD